ncbi:UV damage endonuclease UvsE [Pseudomonas sp. NPDC007930]|uniref:UV damage endonuclease UvsE n=1 Tax=Pseudomonas sp. NPDC007930 TaxID=3364417 RepID=UPI0036EABC4C
MQTPYRLGFACQYRHPQGSETLKEVEALQRGYNPRTTTLRWLGSVAASEAEAKLLGIIEHNLAAQLQLLAYVASLPAPLHMLRLSSDLLPFYSHPEWAAFYRAPSVVARLEAGFAAIGAQARAADIRLSFHPGQYCVLGSDKPQVVENSLAEFEYHADMIRWMGYGQRFQDFKCNVHIAGRLGAEGVRAVWPRLSEVARHCITFENEEKTYGIDACLQLADLAPVVLDIHHSWINEDRRIAPDSPRVQAIIDSWRGVRPVMHYSQPVERLQALGFAADAPLEMDAVLAQVGKTELYGHSAMMWNQVVNRYALAFLDRFDMMFEAKDKNLAVLAFYRAYLQG